MRHEPAFAAASALIDLLMRAAEVTLRDRLVLETGMAAASAESGSLWRRDLAADWRPSVERGRRGGRFEAERSTRRALESPLTPTLPGFALVRAEVGPRGVALVLAGSIDEETEDALEALLACMLIVELADGDAATGPEAPLPALAPPPTTEFGRVQHDVRNALTSLMATRQVLERFGADLASGERQAFTEAVSRECERTGAILAQGLLGRGATHGEWPLVGKCSSAGQVVPAEQILPAGLVSPAGQVLEDVLALEQAALSSLGCDVRTRIAPDAHGLRAACGSEAWSRIVRNLVTNAREAYASGSAGGSLFVQLTRADDGIALAIEDVAGGLPPVSLATLFEDGFTAGKPTGSGQGLAVVRSLTLESRGAILVQRRTNGARFEVWMPVSSRD